MTISLGTTLAYDARSHRMRLTGRGWTAWAGWLLCTAAAWYWTLTKGGQAAWFVASVAGFIVMYAVLVGLTAFARPTVTRSISQDRVHSGEAVRVSIQIERTAVWFPFIWMQIRDVLLGADGKAVSLHQHLVFAGLQSRIRYEYEIVGLPRGVYTFAPIVVAMKEPLGIAGKRHTLGRGNALGGTTIGLGGTALGGTTSGLGGTASGHTASGGMAERRLTVYPKPLQLDAANVKWHGGHGDAAAALATMLAESSLVSTVRDYAHGDPLQRIHWKSTARTGGLKTKEIDALHIRRVTVVLDDAADAYGSGRAGRGRFETAASAACAVIYAAKRLGLAADLRCGAIAGSAAEEDAPAVQHARALTRLAEAEPRGELGLAQVLREQVARRPLDRPLVLVTPHVDAALVDCVGMLRARRIPVTLVYIIDRDGMKGRVGGQAHGKLNGRSSSREDDRINADVNRQSRDGKVHDRNEQTQALLRQLENLRCQVSIVSVSHHLTSRAATAEGTGGVGVVGA